VKNQTILITGGSRGIGAAMVKKFAQNGANVAFTYRNSADKANELIALLSEYEVSIKSYKSDASSYNDTEKLVEKVLNDFEQINVLINNAGITRDNLLLRMNELQWDEVMLNNLKSVFNLTKHVLKPMMKARKGSVINLSSYVGLQGNAGQSNYSASKAGILGFTKSMAIEMGKRNIRFNAIAPGFIETEMTEQLDEKVKTNYASMIPMNRFANAEEVANVALFLASDMSSYINGQTISVCGGLYT